MKAADVVGRKIVSVHQERLPTREDSNGDPCEWGWFVLSFQLDNGSTVFLEAKETDWDPLVTVDVCKRTKKAKEEGNESGD